ncbi:MAG: hypothetical protein E7314_04150 [Clostridiales bacterium]|nr:hypothetical protein [Clostridiales bacterium]
MSTKLNAVLQTSREIYEAEKEKFLDALADFIEANRIAITTDNHYSFYINSSYKGCNEHGKPIYIFYFSIQKPNYEHPGPSVNIMLSKESIIKILEAEYNAKIVNNNNYYCTITLPFA